MKYDRPLRPMVINQQWGVWDPATYSRFGFNRHNGTDYAMTPTKVISCPLDGWVVRVGNQPEGGGIFVSVTDGHMLFDFLHCEKILVEDGQAVSVGDELAIQDNTGFSTGPHTHIQARPISNFNFGARQWTYDVQNDANNSIDPETIWTPNYAADAVILEAEVGLLQKIVALYKQIFNKS